MHAYCSTRANLAPAPAPTAPTLAWQQPLPAPLTEDYDFAIVVDGSGRTYTSGSLLGGTDGVQRSNTVVAIDEDGTLAWTTPFAPNDGIHELFLAADGTLHVHLDDALAVVGRDGTVEATYPLPARIWSLAVGQDGSLYSWIPNAGATQVQFTKLSPTGATQWISDPVDSAFASQMALRANDHAIVARYPPGSGGTQELLELDESGATLWRKELPLAVSDPAIASDETVRIAVGGTLTTDSMHLLSIDTAGNVLWDTDLGSNPLNVWGNAIVIAADGTALAHTNAGVVAVSSSGTILWQKAMEASGYYDAFVGTNGVAVVANFDTLAFDLATGTVRWSLPHATYPIYPPIALAPSGAIVGTMAGNLFLARD